MDIDEETAKMLRIIMKWSNTNYKSEEVKFCIKQTYSALKEGKFLALKD